MGFWKNLRAGAAFMRDYQQDAMQTLPRWARVVRVGRRPFGGVQLQVGQDVFVVGPDTSSDSNHTSWVLDVTRPPQYGSWPTPPEFLRDAPPGVASPAAAPPGFRVRRLQILQVHLRQGTITQEE